jgi:hypothetical protein
MYGIGIGTGYKYRSCYDSFEVTITQKSNKKTRSYKVVIYYQSQGGGLDVNDLIQSILKVGKNKDIFEVHANQRIVPKEEQLEELKREEIDCEAADCSFPVEVEIEIERGKSRKSKMLLCESHAELIEKGIPFRMRSTKRDRFPAV